MPPFLVRSKSHALISGHLAAQMKYSQKSEMPCRVHHAYIHAGSDWRVPIYGKSVSWKEEREDKRGTEEDFRNLLPPAGCVIANAQHQSW